MKIIKTNIAEGDLVGEYLPGHYSDAFAYDISCGGEITADEVQIAFWTEYPLWINFLFQLRDWLVKPLGLEPGEVEKHKIKESITEAKNYKLMSVLGKTGNETVISLKDKHLTAYFSAKVHKLDEKTKRISVSTIVHFHYWLGKVYFYLIYPFHLFVVKEMLKHVGKELAKNKA